MNKLFKSIKEGTDGRGRVVFICKDANGLYVYKPQTGFKSKHYDAEGDSEALDAAFTRQCGCNHQHAFYNDDERPAADEQYPAPVVEIPVVEGSENLNA